MLCYVYLVQLGVTLAAPSMAHYLNQTAKAILDDYDGNMDKLRDAAKRDPAKIHELVKKFKVRRTVLLEAHGTALLLLEM